MAGISFPRTVDFSGNSMRSIQAAIEQTNRILAANQSPVVATLNLLAQQANIPSTTLYPVPVSAGGMYRVSCQTVITRIATGGTPQLPQVNLNWTDSDTGVAEPVNPWIAIALTPLGVAATPNTLGYNSLEDIQTALNSGVTVIGMIPAPPFFAKAGTNILISSTGYAAGTGTPMQYAAHFKVEYLGS